MSRTTLVTTGAIAVLALAASSATAAPAAAGDSAPRPTSEAEAAGIDEPGDAEMGWRLGDERSGADRRSMSASTPSGVPGIDVSSWQGRVDWAGQWSQGKRFAYVKATEGTSYESPTFGHQYTGAYNVGMIRGAYHFALPSNSGGAAQADHFVNNGGGWSADGKTLPGALDMEWNPYGATCYGKTPAQLRSWVNAFLERYESRTGRYPVIYTNATWWNQCIGDAGSIADKSPLWIARYADSRGSLPTGWGWHTFWQYTDDPIDQNVFNGSYSRLQHLATH